MRADAKATIASSLIAGAVAIVVAWMTTGAKFERELSATKDEVAKARADVSSMQAHIGTTEKALAAANATVADIDGKYERLTTLMRASSVQASAPLAAYAVSQSMSIPYGTPTRVNFDKRIADPEGIVITGSNWQLKAPADGFYLIAVSLYTDVRANLRLAVRASAGPVLETPPIVKPENAVERLHTAGVISMRRGETLWIEVTHSMHATYLTAGNMSMVFLRKP